MCLGRLDFLLGVLEILLFFLGVGVGVFCFREAFLLWQCTVRRGVCVCLCVCVCVRVCVYMCVCVEGHWFWQVDLADVVGVVGENEAVVLQKTCISLN